MAQEIDTYVVVLVDTLKRKNQILNRLLELTQTQQQALAKETVDIDLFESVFDEKGALIQDVIELDEGFDSIYQKTSKDLLEKKAKYRDEIQKMQALISSITNTSTQIKAIEGQNNERFTLFLTTEKGKIKSFKVNKNMVSNYYQNMTNSPKKNESYFFDKKK